jgi:hypothetical protein
MSSGISTRAAEHADDAENSLDTVLRTRRHATGRLQVAQFFVILALIAATAAVVVARQSAPEHLILISVTIGAAGAVAFALYRVIVPLTATDAAIEPEPLHDRLRADLEREKMLTLRSIKELEFDRAMGKVSPQDFDDMAARLRARAIGLMKQLDREGSAYEALIERDVAARVAKSVRRAEKETVKPSARHTCACGVRNDPDARFCKACGSKLEAA